MALRDTGISPALCHIFQLSVLFQCHAILWGDEEPLSLAHGLAFKLLFAASIFAAHETIALW
jgi:hypothetical protein